MATANKETVVAKHFGNKKKSPIINPFYKYSVNFARDDVLITPRLKDFYHDMKNIKFGFTKMKDVVKCHQWMTIEHAFQLYHLIDWNNLQPFINEDQMERGFGFPIRHINPHDSPRLHHKVDKLPNWDLHKKDALTCDYWKLYMDVHTKNNDHHPEFWTTQRPGERMSTEATIHLLVDHFVSALRIRDNVKDAFNLFWSWMYEVKEGNIIVNQKYCVLCPQTTASFILYVARVGFDDFRNSTGQERKLTFVHTQSGQTRNPVYDNSFREDLIKIVKNPCDTTKHRTVATKLMGIVNSPFRKMLIESQIHIVAVESMMKKTFNIKVEHDHDKVNSFMNAALALKFLKYKPKEPVQEEFVVETVREFPKFFSSIDLSDTKIFCNPIYSFLRQHKRNLIKFLEQKAHFFDTVDLAGFTREDCKVWSEMLKDDYLPLIPIKILGYEMRIPLAELPYSCYRVYNDKKIQDGKLIWIDASTTRLPDSDYQRAYLRWVRCKLLFYSEMSVINGSFSNHILQYYRHMFEQYLTQFIVHLPTWLDCFGAYPWEFPTLDWKMAIETYREPPHDGYHCIDMKEKYLDHELQPNWKSLFAKVTEWANAERSLDQEPGEAQKLEILMQQNFLPPKLIKMFDPDFNIEIFLGPFSHASHGHHPVMESIKNMCDNVTSIGTGDLKGVVADLKKVLPEYTNLIRSNSQNLNRALNATTISANSVSSLTQQLDVSFIQDQLANITTSIGGAADVIKLLVEKINWFVPDFTHPFGFSLPALKNLDFGDVTAIVIMYILYKNAVGDIKYLYLLGIFWKLGILSQIVKGIKYLFNLLCDTVTFTSNEGGEELCEETFGITDPLRWFCDYLSNHKKIAISLVAMAIIAGFIGYKKYDFMKCPKLFNAHVVGNFKDLNSIAQGCSGIGKMFGFCVTGFAVAMQFVNKQIFGKEFKTVDQIRLNLIEQWLTDVHFASTDHGAYMIAFCPSYREKCKNLFASGLAFQRACIADTLPKHLMGTISAGVSQAKKVFNVCVSASLRKSARRTPTVICFSGDSGLGKSFLTNVVVHNLYGRYFPDDVEKIAYPIKADQGKEDWDGYTGQEKVCIIDDVNVINDHQQVALFITLVSSTPVVLPMAKIEQKGVTFDSQFIVCSTNTPCPVIPNVSHMAAYRNRFHISIKVERNEDYAAAFDKIGQFNIELFRKHYPHQTKNIVNLPHLKFSFMDYRDGTEKVWNDPIDNKTYTDLTWQQTQQFMLTRIDDIRGSDPYAKSDNSVLAIQRQEFVQTINSISEEFEDMGISFPLLETTQKLYSYGDTKLIEMPRRLNDIDFEKLLTFEEDPEETDNVSLDWLANVKKYFPLPEIDAYVDHGTYFFPMQEELVDHIDKKTATDSFTQSGVMLSAYAPEHPEIAMPVKFYRYFTTYSELSQRKRFVAAGLMPNKMRLLLRLKPDEYQILFDPEFRGALWRYANASTSQRLKFVKEEMLPYTSNRTFNSCITKAWDVSKAYAKTALSGIRDSLKAFYNWLVENWKINLTLLAVSAGAIFFLHRIAYLITGPRETAAYNIAQPARITKTTIQPLAHETASSPFAYEPKRHVVDEAELIAMNTVYIEDADRGRSFHGLAIEGRIVAVNHHSVRVYLENNIDDVQLIIRKMPDFDVNHHVTLKLSNMRRIREKDLVYIKFDDLQPVKSIKKKLRTREDSPPSVDSSVVHYYFRPHRNILTSEVALIKSFEERKVHKMRSGNTFTEDDVITICKDSVSGSSGGPMVSLANTADHRLIGIQSCTYAGQSHISSIYLDDYEEVAEELGNIVHSGPFVTTTCKSRTEEYLSDIVNVVGTVPSEMVVRSPEKTSYMKTPIADLPGIESNKEPAILSRDDPRSQGVFPILKAVEKRFRGEMKPLPQKYLDKGVKALTHELRNSARKFPRSVMNITDAIRGRDAEGYSPIPLNTSPGLPYVHMSKLPGKKSFIRYDELTGHIIYLDPYLYNDVLNIDKNINLGIIPPNSMYDFPKDETLPMQKIYDVKTRSITVGNIAWTIIYRMYFGDFSAFLHRLGSTGSSFYAPGINVDSPAWANAYRNLCAVSHMAWDFDVRQWDGSFTMQIFNSSTRVADGFYNDGKTTARLCIAANCCQGFVQIGDAIYQPHRGMGSGYPGTTDINTIGHILLLYTLYQIACEEAGMNHFSSWHYFKIFVFALLYSDDLTIAIAKEIISWFNGRILIKLYERFGWKVTMAFGKEDVDVEHPIMLTGKPVSDVQFLKRRWHKDPEISYITAPLDPESIFDLAYWMRKSDSPRRQFYENLENSLYLAFSHGRGFYDRWLKTINTALSTIKLKTLDYPFEDIHNILDNRYYSCNMF